MTILSCFKFRGFVFALAEARYNNHHIHELQLTITMSLLDALVQSLLSPMVLAFALGIIAAVIKSDLKFPPELYTGLTIYLLFAIGIKGGVKLCTVSPAQFLGPLGVAILLSIAIPIWSFYILKKWMKFDATNAAAVAAHYGSVSAVTFGEAIAFLDIQHVSHEPFLPALLAIMEVPAILIAIFLAGRTVLAANGSGGNIGSLVRELLAGKGTVLLVGGMAIGFLSGEKGYTQVAPLFDGSFRALLTLFLLEIGLQTGRRLSDIKTAGPAMVVFAIAMPLLHGLLGVGLGNWVGLGVGGATVLGTLAASASYIAAPAAVRVALPAASPAIYLTSSLAVTFPFNVVFGIPIYYSFALFLASL